MSNVTSHHHHHSESLQGDSRFECNICFESVQEPVVTRCGHLFCWKCLYSWLEPGLTMEEYDFLGHFRPVWRNVTIDRSKRVCPVCKAKCDVRDVIPIYVKEEVSKEATDTAKKDAVHRSDNQEGETDQDTSSSTINSHSTRSAPNRPQPRSDSIFTNEANNSSTSEYTPPNHTNRSSTNTIYPYAHTQYPITRRNVRGNTFQSPILEAIVQETHRQIHSFENGNENAHRTQIPSLHHRERNLQNDDDMNRTTEKDKTISIFLMVASIFLFWKLVFQ